MHSRASGAAHERQHKEESFWKKLVRSIETRASDLVGTRSRLIRLSTSDGHMRCTASDGRGTAARPASHLLNAYVDVLRRTRRNAYTIRGVAPHNDHRTC